MMASKALRYCTGVLIAGLALMPLASEAQIMRSQVYQYFMKAQRLQNLGQDSAAIAQLDEMAALVPQFPPTYVRMADIYDGMYQRTGKPEALRAAVLMYRKYLTLEFDEERIKEPSARLRQLEDEMNVAHFEDQEMNDSQQSASDNDLQLITDNASAQQLTAQAPQQQAAPAMELVSIVDKATTPQLANSGSKLIPELGDPKFSYLSFYNAKGPDAPHTQPVSVPQLSTEMLQGHWVSETTTGNGREYWIFDIRPEGAGTCSIAMSRESGIVNHEGSMDDEESLFRRALAFSKGYLEKAKILASTKMEVVSEHVTAKVEPTGLKFSIEVDELYQGGTALMKWGRNLASNLGGVLPFGTAISNYIGNYMDQREAQDKTRNRTVTYTFTCKPTAKGVMACEITSVIHSLSETGKARTRVGSSQITSLYQTSAGYTHGQIDHSYSSEDYGRFDALFDHVKADAARDINYNYPLAILYYYGVGTKQSTSKAIETMNGLAAQSGDTRAKAWLSAYFHHKAYNDEGQNTIIRRKYLKSAQYWTGRMHDRNQREWYGVKGDQCNSDQQRDAFTTMRDSALYYYKKGNEAGDMYATYRLGAMYLQRDTRNLQEAQPLLMKAANSGMEEAVLELAHLALQQKDLTAYVHNLTLAADMGCPEAFEELSHSYATGPSVGFRLDPMEGIKMKQLALQAEKDAWIPVLMSFGYDVNQYMRQ